jgi:alanine racemase
MTEHRRAQVDVDLDVIRNNASILAATMAPSMLCVAVKADAYGHGAVPVAKAAIAGGARCLGVAFVEEALQLRDAGLDVPILLLYEAEPTPSTMDAIARARVTPVLYTARGVRAFADAVGRNSKHPMPVHLKIDTGMHRVGAGPKEFVDLCKLVDGDDRLLLEGVSTHFAVADNPEDPFTITQADRFRATVSSLFRHAPPPFLHCCNSAAALLYPQLRMGLVRCGIALYGLPPSASVPLPKGMRPAMSVRAQVSLVKEVPAGDAISYEQKYRLNEQSVIATVPVGYGDGIPRALAAAGGEVLIGGKRRPIAGTITMDQITIDCGDDRSVRVGDEVVFIGQQGSQEVTATEWAGRLGTINYEVVTRVMPRLPRHFVSQKSGNSEGKVDLRSENADGTTILPDGGTFSGSE